jgi:hypothetical protein
LTSRRRIWHRLTSYGSGDVRNGYGRSQARSSFPVTGRRWLRTGRNHGAQTAPT